MATHSSAAESKSQPSTDTLDVPVVGGGTATTGGVDYAGIEGDTGREASAATPRARVRFVLVFA